VDADEAGERSCPAKSATGPIGKSLHRGSATIWPWPSVPYGFGFLASNIFALSLTNADEEVQLSSPIPVAP
jgi:hypothetical protein